MTLQALCFDRKVAMANSHMANAPDIGTATSCDKTYVVPSLNTALVDCNPSSLLAEKRRIKDHSLRSLEDDPEGVKYLRRSDAGR